MKAPYLPMLAFAALILAGCNPDNSQYPSGSDDPVNSEIVLNLPSSMKLTPAEMELVESCNGFTFDLFGKLCETHDNGSVVSSPLSVT
jgi:serine protease inhibitor